MTAFSAFADFRSRTHFFLQTIATLLQRGQIGQHKLRVDHFDVANRIDRAADMMNIGTLKATHHLHDGIDFANMTEELVSQTFSGARTFDQTGDIHELNRRRDNFLRTRKSGQHFQARIGHGHDPEIRINGAEGIICRLRFPCAGYCIKERRFPNIRQTDNSSAQHRRAR